MNTHASVAEAVEQAHRRDWGIVLAATVRATGDLDLAEESVQDAYAAALTQWQAEGIPDRPAAWLTTTARRRATDAVRRSITLRRKLPLLVDRDPQPDQTGPEGDERLAPDDGDIVDERLRLIFLCCHPVLAPEAQVALTLRLVCGVPTDEIAAAFLVPKATMAARITRAKHKIAIARIPLRVPDRDELPERLPPVLDVGYLLLTTGHTVSHGSSGQRIELIDQALLLARAVHDLLPDQPEPAGLLALALLTWGRRATRIDARGRVVPLADQPRDQWDLPAFDEAHALITGALATGEAGRFVLQAAITALQVRPATADEIDWAEVLQLYDALLAVWPSPVVALNRVISLAEVRGPQAALDALDDLSSDDRLRDYRYLHATRAHLLEALDRPAEAASAYRRALELTGDTAEHEVLVARWQATLRRPEPCT